MPTYQYRCTACGKELEAVQKFSDPALTTCPTCSGDLRKVYSAVGVVFKGSGFYATDSRTSNSASKPAATTEAKKSESKASQGSAPAKSTETAKAAS